jgi:hypothetical protein
MIEIGINVVKSTSTQIKAVVWETGLAVVLAKTYSGFEPVTLLKHNSDIALYIRST